MKLVRKIIAYPFTTFGVVIFAIGLCIQYGFTKSGNMMHWMANSIKGNK